MATYISVHRVNDLRVRVTHFKVANFWSVQIKASTEDDATEVSYVVDSEEALNKVLSAFNNVIIETEEEL